MAERTGRMRSDIDWKRLAERKYRIKKRQAETARMHGEAAMLTAQTGETRAERRFGPGGIEQRGQELTEEELTRRYPHGIPAKAAETARISATGYAESAISGAETAAGRLSLEREESVLARKYLFEKEGGGNDISAIKRIATEGEGVAKPGAQECPEGFVWDGKNCVPLR